MDDLVTEKLEKRSVSILAVSMLLITCLAQAERYAYQTTSPAVKNIDRARVIVEDEHLQQGFSYILQDEVRYTPQHNTYVVGQHCYRGDSIRFDIPREKFTFYIDNEEYHPPWGSGGSVWHRFHTGGRLNFLLIWIDSAYSVVELDHSACADIVLDTRYHVEEKLRKANNPNVPIVVRDRSGRKVGEFNLKIRE